METRVSFFTVAGFLVPGIVFGLILSPLALERIFVNSLPAWLLPLAHMLIEGEAVAVAIISFIGFGLLACSFSMGIFLSYLYLELLESVRLLRSPDRNIFEAWLSSGTLRELLAKDWLLQEAYVLSLTQGPDVYGYVARNGMLGASGFAVLVAGVIYLCSQWFVLALILILLGVMFMAVGASLVRRYRKWIAAYAALFLLTGSMVKLTSKAVDGGDE